MQVHRRHKFLVLGAIAVCLIVTGLIVKRARGGSPNERG